MQVSTNFPGSPLPAGGALRLWFPLFFTLFIAVLLTPAASAQQWVQLGADIDGKASGDLLFMENRGQVRDPRGRARPDILFLAKGGGAKVAVRANGISYQFEKVNAKKGAKQQEKIPSPRRGEALPKTESVETYRLDMFLEGANPAPEVVRETEEAYFENYYNIPAAPEGIVGVKSFSRIRLKSVYPGIDWVIYANAGQMKYDFIVQPGADPAQIQLRYAGSADMRLNADGSLVATTPLGEVREQMPVSFQDGHEIASRFVLAGERLSFTFSGYDPARPLVVDPGLVWATYYGGTGYDIGYSTAIDASGGVYLAGVIASTSGIASGGHQNTFGGGGGDAFLVKFDASGVRQWATYYGGTGDDAGRSTATDANGNVYLAGETTSTSGIASGGHQNTFGGGDYDAFLVKFNASGVRQWGTYYGGTGTDIGQPTTTDGSGNVYLAGYASSTSGIASGGHQNTYGGGTYDAFLVKFNASGVRQWGTYYGGTGTEYGLSTAADGSGDVYLAGSTTSNSGIASGGHQNTYGGGSFDAYLVKFNASGVRQWATYYGGTGNDTGYSTAIDASGDVYLAGTTASTSGITSGGHQNTYGGGPFDAFLVKFNASGVRQWGTYYGGTGNNQGWHTATDGNGNVYLAGSTTSNSGIASGGHQNTYGGGSFDAILIKFDASGIRQWGTYYGGEDADYGYSTATDASDNVYLAGVTASTSGIASGGHQNTLGGGTFDAFFAKLEGSGCPATGTIWYVDAAVASGGTGSSWGCAFQNLQDAIDAASSGHEIWVKEGTYKPSAYPLGCTGCATARDYTFHLKDGVALYGGFNGSETQRTERDPAANPTRLSGDIGIPNDASDNCYHVLLSILDGSATVVDGFTVEQGHAGAGAGITVETKVIARNGGGGMLNHTTTPTVHNCIFSGNQTSGTSFAGGMYNELSDLSITNCVFSGNTCTGSGGGVVNFLSGAIITNCTFTGNTATERGGGIHIVGSPASTVTHCAFTSNTAANGGGMQFDSWNSVTDNMTMTHCVFSGNSASSSGGGVVHQGNNLTLTNCLLSGNKAPSGGGLWSGAHRNSVLTNCVFSGNWATNTAGNTGGGIFTTTFSTATLKNCLLWNNRAGNITGSAEATMKNLTPAGIAITYSLLQNWNPAGAGNLDGIAPAADANYPSFLTPLDPATAPSTSGDFHITGCSPVLNLGNNTDAPADDLFDNPRPFGAAVDLGVHELQSVSAVPTTAAAGPDQTGSATCGLPQVTLAGNAPVVGTGMWSVVSGSGGSFGNSGSPTSTFSGTAGTAYVLRWTISNSPCTASTDNVNVTFNRNPTAANAGPDQTVCCNTATLAANTPGIGTGTWSIISGAGGSFGNANSPTSTFSGTSGTTYTLRWTISNAPCTASTDDMMLTFSPPNYTISTTGNAIVVTDLSGNGDILFMSESGSNIQFNVTGRTYSLNSGAVLNFPVSVPLAGVTAITVNAQGGNDVINISAFAANLPSLTLNGGTGDDVINFNGDITFAANANLNADLQDDDPTPGVDALAIGANDNIIFTGAGTVTVKVSKQVSIGSNGSLETMNGDLTVDANQQATPVTSVNFSGVLVDGGILRVNGSGLLTAKGRGGSNINSANQGVAVVAGGKIQGGSALVTIVGTSGLGTNNNGVYVSGNGSEITSSGGNVSVTGQGGGTTTEGFSNGVRVQQAGKITAGGTGTVTVIGTGSGASGNSHYGVYVTDANSVITSSGGNVSVTGQGGGSSSSINNYGILVNSGGQITVGGTGSVTVTGTGGTASGSGNFGINLAGPNSKITSSGGNVMVTGQGGGTSTANLGIGINVEVGGQITAGGTGTVTVMGTGGATSGNSHYGVIVINPNSAITSSGGNVSVTGRGGGTGNSSNNYGIIMNNTGQISAGGTGIVTVQGTGGASTGASNHGIYLISANTKITANNGNIFITGIVGGGNSAIGFENTTDGAVVGAPNGGNVTLNANSMSIGGPISAQTGNSVTLRPNTNGIAINLAAATDPANGPLCLTDAELDLVTCGTLVIGSANAGAITLSAAVSRPANTHVQLLSAGDVTFSGGGLNTAGGNLLLDPGASPAAVKPAFNGTDATCATLSFASDLAFVLNGLAPGNGTGGTYTQLNVAGAVDLTGVDLLLSGSYAPIGGETFTLVENDGADAIIGTFTGLPQGATISNILGSGLSATISYTGGSGNDVVLTLSGGTTCPANFAVCRSDAPFALTGGTPAGGTYSGTGVSSGQFDPAAAGAGSHTITYANITSCTFVITVRPANAVWYVDASAASGGNGTSWGTAFQSLQDALSAACGGHEIWVKEGTYKPSAYPLGCTGCATARDYTFHLKDGVALYGGFNGTETQRTERDPAANPTRLSGDIGIPNDASDNCYHVLLSILDGSATVVDGFTVEQGHAGAGAGITVETKVIARNGGGGMLNHTTNLTVHNCVFSGNQTSGISSGGGMFNLSSGLSVTNCVFSGNTSTGDGGGIRNSLSAALITNCTFTGNTATGSGGGMHTSGPPTPTVTHCTFTENTAGTGGGVLFNVVTNQTASMTMTHCVFSGNTASSGGGGVIHQGTNLTLTNCLFSGNKAAGGGGLFISDGRNFVLTNCVFSGNWATNTAGLTGGGIFTSLGATATLKNCLLWNNRAGSVTGSAAANMETQNPAGLAITYSLLQSWNPAGAGNLDGIAPAADANYPGFLAPLDPATAPSTSGDFHLHPCSPVLNLGDNTDAPTDDLFGNPRPFGAAVDLGVHEVQNTVALSANAGPDQTGAATCGLTQVTLAANVPSIGTGTWSIVSGTGGSFGNTTSATSSFSGNAGATYTLRWTVANPPCAPASDDVMVTFNQNPTFSACPGTTTVSLNTGCAATVTYNATANVSPAPSIAHTFSGATVGSGSGTGSGATFNLGTTTVTLTATSNCGTTTCAFNVVVQAPEIGLRGNGMDIADGDNTPSTADHTDFGTVSGSLTRTFTVQNTGMGNLAVTGISLTGTGAAMFSVGPLLPAGPVPSGQSASFEVTYAPSAAGIHNASVRILTNDCDEGEYDFAVRGEPSCATPGIACPGNMIVNTQTGLCTGTALYTPTVLGVPTPTVSYILTGATTGSGAGTGSGNAVFNKGITTVRLNATNNCGNVSCTFRVTVVDGENPSIVCPSVPPAATAANACASASIIYPAPTATDNCTANPTVVRIGGLPSGAAFPTGATTVIWRAVDGVGRSSTCSFAVVVSDAQAPTVVCPPNITQTNSANACNTPVVYANPTATDNCGLQSSYLFSGFASGSVFPLGTTTNLWRAVDEHGLSETCSFTVTVLCPTVQPPSGAEDRAGTASDLWLTPNPTATEVNISTYSEKESSGTLSVYDATGRLVWQQTLTTTTVRLDVSTWPSGVYAVSWQQGKTVSVKRLYKW